jgi:phytoene synthase
LLVPGHPLTLTLPYADSSARDALLVVHALIGEIASVPGSVSDPDVARRKLGWWREALADQLPHPAVQAWARTGLSESLPPDAFAPLIDAVRVDIDPPRFEREEDFDAHCRRLAGAGAWLEARLIGARESDDSLRERLVRMAGAAYRVRVARDLVMDARAGRWSVPLDLQAEHRLTRDEVARAAGGYRFEALVRHLAGPAALEIQRQQKGLDGGDAWRHRHQLLRQHLDQRLGKRLVQRPGRAARERVASGRFGDAVAVWRRARRLRRTFRD